MFSFFKKKPPVTRHYLQYPIFNPVAKIEGSTPVEKAKDKLKKLQDYELCINARICPECGSELIVEAWDEGDDNHDPEMYSVCFCDNCHKRTEVEEY